MTAVDLVVNVYERTFRDVLTPSWWDRVQDQNQREFAGRWVMVNNTENPRDVGRRADGLVASGHLTGWVFVEDLLDAALTTAALPRRALGSRPYFLDYGLVMPLVGVAPFVLGWDAETYLTKPAEWVSEAVDLMRGSDRVFSAAPRWPSRDADSLADETIETSGSWALNWGFSDQVFLVRRADMLGPVWRKWAPASWLRHAQHPFTFEGRMESLQRATRRYRATHLSVTFGTNDLPLVLSSTRLGMTRPERIRTRVLEAAHRRFPRGLASPRLHLP
jgi:hypothetical protein